MMVLVICLNIFAVGIHGTAEFIFPSITIIAILVLLLFALIIDPGEGPTCDPSGIRYRKHAGAMKPHPRMGSAGRFPGFIAKSINAGSAYGGVKIVAVAAGEVENPRSNLFKAVHRMFWLMIFF